MAKSFPAQTDKERHHRGQTSAAMKRMAAANRCPMCKRKSAIKRTIAGDHWLHTCRWCDYERGGYLAATAPKEKPCTT